MQVGSHYVLFLEKACEMFSSMARSLPQYGQILTSCKQHFETAQQDDLILLSYVYADIVTFCLELYCMFSRGFHGTSNYVQIIALPGTPLHFIRQYGHVRPNAVTFEDRMALLVWTLLNCL
jgi:hypothetical protein